MFIVKIGMTGLAFEKFIYFVILSFSYSVFCCRALNYVNFDICIFIAHFFLKLRHIHPIWYAYFLDIKNAVCKLSLVFLLIYTIVIQFVLVLAV